MLVYLVISSAIVYVWTRDVIFIVCDGFVIHGTDVIVVFHQSYRFTYGKIHIILCINGKEKKSCQILWHNAILLIEYIQCLNKAYRKRF